MADRSGYAPGNPPSAIGGGAIAISAGLSHQDLKGQYTTYLDNKAEEIKEQKDSRRYFHGSHWTAKQIKAFNDRRQPIVTFNYEARKVNGIVGHLARQRSDPKAYPRTEKHTEGAALSTAVIRYVMDDQRWDEKDPECTRHGAIDGIGGVELQLYQGDTDDPNDHDVGFDVVDPSGFFYDPRSLKPDFSDARYMGIGKWADLETLVEQFPDKEIELRASMDDGGAELTSNPDSDNKWFSGAEGKVTRMRVVDHWYVYRGTWRYCVYTGAVILIEGESPFRDQKRKTICKFIMFSANVDHDGDRYGFHRNMKSGSDEVNQRRSKGLHIANTRRMVVEEGQGIDIENVRREAARPDGVITHPPGTKPPTFDDGARAADLAGQMAFYQEAKAFLDNVSFNPSLVGTGVNDMSGRAIRLQQEAGLAELGPFISAYRGWKLRLYRAVWCAIRDHWTAERAVRVTDDENAIQFLRVNQIGTDPRTGMPAVINHLGSLDVDIIMDEGPDAVNSQADALEILTSNGPVPLPLLMELLPLPEDMKKRLEKRSQPVNPAQQIAAQLELQGKKADNDKTAAETAKIVEETRQMGADGQGKLLDLAAKQDDRQFRQVEMQHDARMGELELIGKRIDLAKAAQQPQQAQPSA